MHARITVLAPAEEVLARINATVGVVESLDEQTCVLVTGADSLETIAVYIGMLGLDFKVSEPAGLVDHPRLGERYLRATTDPHRPPGHDGRRRVTDAPPRTGVRTGVVRDDMGRLIAAGAPDG